MGKILVLAVLCAVSGYSQTYETKNGSTSLPTPTSSTLGGTKSLTCSAGNHIAGIDTTGTPSCTGDATANEAVNAQVGTTYTVVDGDRGKLITFSNASSIAVTLPQAGAGGLFSAGWYADVVNNGAGTVTITPTTSTINGAATRTVVANQGIRIVSDGTNYQVQQGSGVSAGAANAVQYAGASGTFAGLINSTATNKFVTQSNSAAPAFNTIAIADLPSQVMLTNANATVGAFTYNFASAAATIPHAVGLLASRPASCIVGQTYFSSDASPGTNISVCTATNTWTGSTSAGPGGSTNALQYNNAGIFGGILNTTGTKQFVSQTSSAVPVLGVLQSTDLPATAIKTDANATAGANTYNFSGAAHVLPIKTGLVSGLPATCTVGEEFFASDATAGQNNYYCTATNTWTQQLVGGTSAGVNGTSVPTNSAANQVLLTTAAATGSWASVPNCLDSVGNHLNFNTTTHAWSCGTSGGTGSPDPASIPYSNGFTGATPGMTLKTKLIQTMDVREQNAQCDVNAVADAAISNASTTLTTSTSVKFVSADVGKVIVVYGAGVSGADLVTTISAFTNNHQLTLGAAASTTVTGAIILWGTDDTAAFTNSMSRAMHVMVPENKTCYVHNPTFTSHTYLEGGSNTTLFDSRANNTSPTLNVTFADDVKLKNLTIDQNGNDYAGASAKFILYIQGDSDLDIDNVTFQNSGKKTTSTNGVDWYDSSGEIRESFFASGVIGNQLVIDPNYNVNNRIKVYGNRLIGSAANGIVLHNTNATTGPGVCNIEVNANYFANITDGFVATGDTGQNGNAIDIDKCNELDVHDNKVFDVRSSGVRIFQGNRNNIHNNYIDSADETSLYCGELGSSDNYCHHNTIVNYVSGISDTNISNRVGTGLYDAPNIIESNRLINGTDMAITCEHCVAVGNQIDGVPLGITVGRGAGDSHDTYVVNNTCTRSQLSYPQLNICIAIESNMAATSIDHVAGNQTKGGTPINNIQGLKVGNEMQITSITNGTTTLVGYTGGDAPTVGSVVCFHALLGETNGTNQLNGQCPSVTAIGTGTFTVNFNSTAYSAWNPNSDWQEQYASIVTNSSGNPKYTINGTVLIENEQIPANVVSNFFNGSHVYVTDGTCVGGLVSASGGGPGTFLFQENGQHLCLTGSSPTTSITDFPSKSYFPSAGCNNSTAGPGWNIPATSAPTISCHTGTNVNDGVLAFSDGESAQFSFLIPDDWDVNSSADAKLFFTDAATSGTVIFQIALSCTAGNGSAVDDTAFNTAQSFGTITVGSPASEGWVASITGITKTGCQPGYFAHAKVIRTTDTAVSDALVSGLQLTLRRSF